MKSPISNENRLALPVAIILDVFAIGLVALTCMLLFSGCTIHIIYDPATGHPVAKSISPWAPWFNNQATLANLALTSETNHFRLGVKGVATSQTADTNILNTVTSLAEFGKELAKRVPAP